jgi:hypothetical protein
MKDHKIITDGKSSNRSIEEKGWNKPESVGGGFYIYRDDQFFIIGDRRSLSHLFKQKK